MTSMSLAQPGVQTLVYAGVDTHQLTHQVAVIDPDDRLLGQRQFPVNATGYRDLATWVSGFGVVVKIGVESTGGYGAGLTRHLLAAGIDVVEVNRPDKTTRAMAGKSDPIDALAAARAARTGRASATPKVKTGPVESLRMIKIARDSAVKDRTRALGQLRDLATTAPTAIHDELIGLTGKQRTARAARFRPDPTRLADPVHAAKHAMRTLAQRIVALTEEIATADHAIDTLTADMAPTLRALPQVGPQIAAQLLITAGQNLDRMRSEASFAKLAGVAPVPASSGKHSTRMRLNRGGDRHANSALYLIVIGRLRNHQPTITYRQRRQTNNKLGNRDTIRCLKRYVAREVYQALKTDLTTT